MAFADGGESEYETPYDRMNRKNREEAEARDTPERRKDSEGIMKALKFAGGLPIEALKHLVSAPGYGLSRLMEGEAAPKATPAVPAADNRAMLNKADAAVRSAPMEQPAAAPAPAPAPAVARAPAPAGLAALAAPRAAAPAAPSDALQILTERMKADPEARAKAEAERYERMVGKPDTAQHDRLIAELEGRKKQLEPKQGFEGLMEYLGQVSRADVRGRGSFASGAAGAARLEDLNKERQLQQFELSKQAIEVSQKKLDTVRSFAKEQYNVGKSAFDQVYKDQHESAKEVVKDEQAAKQLAQQNTLKILEMQNQREIAAGHNAASLAAAKLGLEGREAARTTLTPAQRAEIANKAADNVQAELAKDPKSMMAVGKNPALRATLVQRETERLLAAAEGRTMAAAPGAGSPGGTNQQGWGIKELR